MKLSSILLTDYDELIIKFAKLKPRIKYWTNEATQEDQEELNQYFYHKDHLGSSTQISDNNANIIQHIEYLPYGESFFERRTDSWNTPYKFNAKELDEETGMYYYGARYFTPDVSIWLSVDPMSDKYPHLNPYMYVAGNPIIFIDPNGEDIVVGLVWAQTPDDSGHMALYVDTYKSVTATVTENGRSVTKKMYVKTGTVEIQNYPGGGSATVITEVDNRDDSYLDENVVNINVNTVAGVVGNDGNTYYSAGQVQKEINLYNDAEKRRKSSSENDIYSHGESYLNQNDCSSIIIDLLADNGFIQDRGIGITKTTVKGQTYQFYTPNAITLDLMKIYKGRINNISEMQQVTYKNAREFIKNEIEIWTD